MQNGKCVWSNCGIDQTGFTKSCLWDKWPAIATLYKSTLPNGCHPLHNKRLGDCVKCASSYSEIIGTKGASPQSSLRKELLISPSTKVAYWMGSLETELWRSRCDIHGCGFMFADEIHDFNTFDVRDATTDVFDVRVSSGNKTST